MFFFKKRREIHKIYISRTMRSVFLSFITIYIPIFLLVHGYSLNKVIIFYIINHLSGLIFLYLFLVPYLNKYGPVRAIKLHYPFQIAYYLLIYFFIKINFLFYVIAVIGGISNFLYQIPLIIMLVKNSDKEKMGSDLSWFFALPKFFGIISPLLSALLIPIIGFKFMFVIAILGLVLSYLPISSIRQESIKINIKLKNIFQKIKQRKYLLFLEMFDNILEESEWFWGIFVYLMIGSISAPGFVGSLESLGGALFTILVGKYANKNANKLIILSSFSFSLIWFVRFFIKTPMSAYAITVLASFTMTMFLVSYFAFIYKKIKDKQEAEFLILREIPTVLGRLILFATILLFINNLRLVFFLPIFALLFLVLFLKLKNKSLNI